jgi:hypothetical protein
MDETTVEISTEVWTSKMADYIANVGGNMRSALDEEWPLLMELIVRLTPPKSLAQGRKAVSSDIHRTMRSFDPALIKTEGIREIVERKNYAAFDIVASRVKGGYMANAKAAPFDPFFHTSQRNARGRVNTKRPIIMLGDDSSLLKKYVKQVQDRVGYAKAGWLKALHLVGGRMAPGFVEKQHCAGDVIDDRNNPDDPSITAINRTPWAVRKDEGMRIVHDAKMSRAISIESKIKTKLRMAREEASLASA